VARVVYSAGALRDLERIVDFLLEASPESAEQAVAQITDALGILAGHPRIGRRVQGPLRELVISLGASGYLALYRFDRPEDVVRVLHVRHQREAGYQD
jgi:plasmid stabilization system protein ParE